MKKITALFLSFIFLSGCTTYKFQRGQPPHNKGYVALRDGYTILEYTLGTDNTVAETVSLAKDRLRRRKKIVEHYYKKMRFIESKFKQNFLNPPLFFVGIVTGVFRLPGIAISDFKYGHNPKYKAMVDEIQAKKDAREETRIALLKAELNKHIQKDLAYEQPGAAKKATPQQKKPQQTQEVPKAIQPSVAIPQQQAQEPPKPIPETVAIARQQETKQALDKEGLGEGLKIEAVIIAKPANGFSPLTVHFYGNKSFSAQGKIVSYLWDFGDGDTSTKANPLNTYYSASFEPRDFTATLTVKDEKINTATASVVIEVRNK